MFNIYCDDYDFCAVAKAMDEELGGNCGLSAEIIFTDEEEIRRLNRETRGTDAVTDVLSYPSLDGIKGRELKREDYAADLDEEGNIFLGSIAICTARAKQQAEEYGHGYGRELNYLVVHGLWHLLGYDHMTEEDKPEMRAREEAVMNKLGLARD